MLKNVLKSVLKENLDKKLSPNNDTIHFCDNENSGSEAEDILEIDNLNTAKADNDRIRYSEARHQCNIRR